MAAPSDPRLTATTAVVWAGVKAAAAAVALEVGGADASRGWTPLLEVVGKCWFEHFHQWIG